MHIIQSCHLISSTRRHISNRVMSEMKFKKIHKMWQNGRTNSCQNHKSNVVTKYAQSYLPSCCLHNKIVTSYFKRFVLTPSSSSIATQRFEGNITCFTLHYNTIHRKFQTEIKLQITRQNCKTIQHKLIS